MGGKAISSEDDNLQAQISDDPRVKARIAELGGEALPGSPAEFTKLIAADSEKWCKVILAAGIKAG